MGLAFGKDNCGASDAICAVIERFKKSCQKMRGEMHISSTSGGCNSWVIKGAVRKGGVLGIESNWGDLGPF